MVDRAVLAAKTAAISDAIARVRSVLPPDVASFNSDRTAREVVVLNLFVALQECLALATHWLADSGREVPGNYRGIFTSLANQGLLPGPLAERLAAASGFRNLIAHRYGVLDPALVHRIAKEDLGDLEQFCSILSTRPGH